MPRQSDVLHQGIFITAKNFFCNWQ